MSGRRRQTRGGFGLLLLASQIMNIGPGRIPPVTLLTVAVNVIVYMKLIPSLPSVHAACTSNNYVLVKRQWPRLFYSSFYHLDDMHLYFNMVSFIWKGMKLENKMKSKKFAIVICLFSLLTQVVMLAVNKVFAELLSDDQYLFTCAAGFSAVIFSLKVLTTYNSDSNVSVMGMPMTVPAKYACWVELILIHFLVPNSSFTGHLSGIFVGLMYTHGPLKKFVKLIKSLMSDDWWSRPAAPQASYNRQAEATGYRNAGDDEDAELQQAIRESLRNTNFTNNQPSQREETQHQPSAYGWNIPSQPQSGGYNLYPNPDVNERGPRPSAPPMPTGTDGPPYPTSNNPPYPVPNSGRSSQYGDGTEESSEEMMRRARLRKFQN